jgi:hypothetical protein
MRRFDVVAITLFGSVAIIAIVALMIFVPGDTSTAVGHVLVIVTSVLTLLRSTANGGKLRALHVDVNDRLSQLIIAEKSTSRAEGATEERERGKRPGASL